MTAASEILQDLTARGVTLQADGDALRFTPRHALTPELLERLREHKAEILRLLAGGVDDPADGSAHGPDLPDPGGELELAVDATGRRTWRHPDEPETETAPVPDPCPSCGGIEQWRDLQGGWHCLRCDPCTAGPRLRKLAMRRPKQPTRPAPTPGARRPQPPVVPDAIVADPIPTCSDCGRPEVIPGQPGRRAGLCFDCWRDRQ